MCGVEVVNFNFYVSPKDSLVLDGMTNGKAYPVLAVSHPWLLVPDDNGNLRWVHAQNFKFVMTDVVSFITERV